ncbi:bifunctional alpha,alpha-trehalose-phosphate synthase (UDP-forming)/trehalose-phosphatase [Pedobacter psychrophilus]|uniref:Bifunctional alpha,alpha-trehalose-phosphate synthase (UDP-forming)/trehalose-phosphatase n=1 Tax=Pedobacter psychrophilus TaxID=1826909 RepID=A0A179DCW6_9SPHI|nr:bifunctional alpha,alpha-trehalose-phosphate synthase (UDP-forming)/trehalose-phosphatase [Pedobacter psychrophilus]OAQ38881.1 bifunctional alpha,alpha-trehalose-phosphate synthase (UDP-forming)/trehalose-phosphatase [Pedobacter psychrophilus]
MRKTIIISNRLPVKIAKENEEYHLKVSEGGLATGLGSIYKEGDNIWIGWAGLDVPKSDEQEIIDKLKQENLLPVFLTPKEIQNYYEGFSNETLWPIFHYMSTYAQYEQEYWDYYRLVNEKFKNVVLKIAKPGDIIWIHDYQLLLLPQMIREELPNTTIGFFQHIPFPSYELFRLIPWRAELLDGILGADLIGFHTYDDVRHFTSSATRVLPVQTTANIIHKDDRNIVIDAFPMGIDSKKFNDLTFTKEVLEEKEIYNQIIGDTKIILSIDRLDYSKGIIQRLLAFDKVLADNPQYLEKISMHMIVVPSRDTIPQYRDLRDDIDKLVGNINSRYRTSAWHPIHYFYRSFPIEILSSLYSRADICLVTPMRDGMNLVSKEYIASKTDETGVLILSEMAGASKELIEAIIVNPNNLGEMYRAIVEALEMPEEEKISRMKNLRKTVMKFDINHWVKIFMNQLEEVKEEEKSRMAKYVNQDLKHQFKEAIKASKKRVFFLDYDGTLVNFNGNPLEAKPDEELYQIINDLNSDDRNQIVIISGRKYETLGEWFGHLKVDLIAEHGAWKKFEGKDWQEEPNLSDKWKQAVMPMLESYSDRTAGSFIEEKRFSLAWHYRKVEKGLGDLRANELISNMRYLIREKDLQLLPGNKVVEIKNSQINKGKAAASYIYGKNFDFILAMGDDHTDEDIFTSLPYSATTIKVGSSISEAKFYLRSVEEARALLQHFCS